MGKMVQKLGTENIVTSNKEDRDIHKTPGACVVPGYGLTEWNKFQMRWPKTLKKYIPDMMKPFDCTGPYLKKLLLCASNTDLTSTCQYDEGSPLLCKKDGLVKLFGLTTGLSHARYCDQGLSLFTRVSTYYKWITRVSKKLQRENSDVVT
ncbi:chymotrypsinogen B-like [Mercenaria mercenaria]|uniref:chymotrypsinogen B-like n=1 Tax=Mercenaria mercenaria TaxID=6596 RepID=UPI00234F7268|nr:chymotrypsinogen B-like [Mercenaria mercenaria]XP_053399175.1 chymotrypsinogen B-like [Mercenaria mercenaria]